MTDIDKTLATYDAVASSGVQLFIIGAAEWKDVREEMGRRSGEVVRYCCSCQKIGEVDPRSVSCCPDAPGSVAYVPARFASRLAREFDRVRNGERP
jgi:hypothetical protein